MANPKLIPVPFANAGTKTTIPVTRASNDAAEMPDYDGGFPPITSTPLAAGGKAPRRPDFNGILNDITANVRHLNSGGFFTFDAAFAAKIGGYPKGAVLLSNDGAKKYVSLIDGNTSDFNVSVDAAKWAKTSLTERETQDIAWGAGKTSAPWAPLDSPALIGTPTAPTAVAGTNTTQLATTAFVQSAVSGYISLLSTGGTLVLTEAQVSNPVIGFGGVLTSDLSVVVPDNVRRLWAIANWTSGNYNLIVKTASGNGVTVAQGKRNLVYSNGAHVYDAFNDFENIAISGISTAPTASTGTRSTQLATTAFVGAECAIAAPTGSVYTFAGATVPAGWLKCNGALLSRTTYAALFAVIGAAYGAGDGSTTFALPDLRGEFVRGADDGRGVDAGRALGSTQSDEFRSHTHSYKTYGISNNDGSNTGYAQAETVEYPQSGATGGSETRPRNVAMHFIIKY